MCLIRITPLQSATEARRNLDTAMRLLAEAQVAVAQALKIAAMAEDNWRLGAYREGPAGEVIEEE